MKKKLFFVLGLLMAVVVQVWADSPIYTLTAVKNASNSTYASTYDVTVNGMTWNVPGNQNFDGYWRIGGSSLTNASRVMYSKTAMQGAARRMEIQHNGVSNSNFSVGSVTMTVASDAAFSNIIDEVTAQGKVDNSSSGIAGKLLFVPSSGKTEWAAGSYYKITFVVSNSRSSNNGLNFVNASWYAKGPVSATLKADAQTVLLGDSVHFSVETANTDTYEFVELVYQQSSSSTVQTTSETFIDFSETTGTYDVYARVRVDGDTIINTNSLAITVKTQTTTVTLTPATWATEQDLDVGDEPETIHKEDVSVAFGAGTGSAVTYNGSAFTMNAGNTLAFSVAGNNMIKTIHAYTNTAAQKTVIANGTWSSGTATADASSTSMQVIWSGMAQSVSVVVNGTAVITKIVVYYADINAKFFVTFYDADDNVLERQKVRLGATATPPTPPAIQNKHFIGWKRSSTLYSSEQVVAEKVTANVSYTAAYEFNADVVNETTTITTNEVLAANGITTSGYQSLTTLDITKNSKSVYFNKGTGSSTPRWYKPSGTGAGYVTLYTNNTIRIKSNNMMHRITFAFSASVSASNMTAPDKLHADGQQLIWEGSSADITFTYCGSNFAQLLSITIESDQNNTSAMVTFIGIDGQIIQQQELPLNSKVTAPAFPENTHTGMHYLWDKTFSRATEDITISMIEEPIVNMNVTATYFGANAQSISEGGFTYSLTENNATLFTRSKSVSSERLIINDSIKVTSTAEPLRTIRINSSTPDPAKWIATSGAFKEEDGKVVWYGVSNAVTFTCTSNGYYLRSVEALSSPQTVKVIFLCADSTLITTQEVEVGASTTSPTAPVLEDMEQTGWMINGRFVNLEDFEKRIIMDETTCVAKYEFHTYTITFLDPDGELLTTQKVKKGESPISPVFEMPVGATLTGWVLDNELVTPENLTTIQVNDFLTFMAQYSVNEGYHLVLFKDSEGKILSRKYVANGQPVAAPEAPEIEYFRLAGWQAESSEEIVTNERLATLPVTADISYTAVYELDIENATPLTVNEAHAICSTLPNYKISEKMYLVKGIISNDVSYRSDYVVSFAMNWDNGDKMYVDTVPAPVLGRSDLQVGDTVLVYAHLCPGEHIFMSYRTKNTMSRGYVAAIYNSRSLFPSEPAHLLYDFTGDGVKEYIRKQSSISNSKYTSYIVTERNPDGKYTSRKILFDGYEDSNGANLQYFEDINGDGQPDLSMMNNNSGGYNYVMVSGEEGYTRHDSMSIITNFDINRDGRQDYIFLNQSQAISSTATIYYGDIAYQQADGTFHSETMQVMTWPEYQAQMTPEELAQMNNPGDYSLGDVSRYVYTISYYNMVGADLASAPKRRAARKAQSVGHILSAPTKAIDLNADGMMDLVDEKDGVIYTNMGNAKWVMTATNGTVIPADLNGDGVTDFIFPGSNLYVSIFNKTTNSFTTTNLYSNAAVDEMVYTYDFDRDGDIDILATFTATNNATKTAYTCFFRNDGNGNFTRQPEQSYGSNNLLFENLQDIDGDGYLDLLAIRGNITTGKSTISPWYFNIPDSSEVVWLQGQAALQFAQPDSLFIIPKGFRQNIGAISSHNVEYEYPLQAEDLDNDGKIDIWLSGLSSAVTLALRNSYTYPSAQANAAPTAPVAPELQYNDGLLTITWGNGSDDHTMPCDLTYALRIGTSSGAMDIVRPHANADGSRRNFLDGNMGRNHSYTIDLSSYSPMDVYVAVQAIDAQHVGSAWSAEATVRHEKLPAEFTLSSEVIRLNEKLTITYTPMPEGYSHTWSVGDGVINEVSASQLEVSFPTGGEKTITHTLTAPDSRQAVSEQRMRVLPVGVSRRNDYLTSALFYYAQADINYDGRGDVLGSSAVLVGDTTGSLATQAEGLWNTNFLTPSWHPTSMWYDYNRDGQVDLMLEENYGSSYQYAYLPHAANAPTLSDRVDDDAIENLFGYFIRDNMGREIGRVVCLQRDFTHNGRYDVFEKNRDAQNQDVLYLRVQQEDGTYATQTSDMALYEFMNGEETYKRFAEDINHDGFIDLVLMNPSALKVAYNRGGGVFDIQSIPFANDLGYDYYKPSLVDFNGDGYLDLLYVSGKAVYVMWNTTNTSYSVPVHLLDNAGDEISILDIDANGYPDIATTMTDPATKLHGLYIWFMGPNGVVIEGKFMDNVASSTYGTKGAYLACGESYLMSTYSYRLLPQNEDAAPAVPIGLTAQSTDDGLLIQWNDAADDHTPAALMRYNLAVRLQGSTTYLISPLNGANNGTMPLSDYRYISATQFLIPSSALTTGTYEIQLQALDMQQHFSNFTPVLTATYTRTNVFEMDEEACTNDEVLISYRGAVGQSSPSWTFDGGSIVSGKGYGPYTVTWNSGGDKRVTITVDGVTYADTIYISNPREMQVYIPSTLLMDQAATAEIPADATAYQWYVRIGEDDDVVYKIGSNGIDMSTPARVLYDKRLTVDGLQITAHEISGKTSLTQESIIKLYLVVYNSHGCEVWFMTYATVIGDVVAPTIDLVTVDANAHNVINFSADAANFPMVRILKETNVLNEFAEVAVVPATNGSYTDLTSDATQQPDRYKIQGVMANGDYSTESAIHKTVHATINRGVREGTYNLIWNAYEGAEIVTYNILRGSSAATLAQIASVASSATSYTDQAPLDAEPYYVVEYVLVSSPSASPARRAPAASQATLIGRSNIVERESGQTPPEPVYYTIRFLNYDSSVLQSTRVLEGERPVYTGATPAKPEDDNYTYEFSGWLPAILPAFADTDYTAQFTSTRKSQGLEDVQSDNVQCTKVLINNVIYIRRGDRIYTIQGQEVR